MRIIVMYRYTIVGVACRRYSHHQLYRLWLVDDLEFLFYNIHGLRGVAVM